MNRLFSFWLTIALAGSLAYAAAPAKSTRKTSSATKKKRKAKKPMALRLPYVDPTLGDNVDGDDLTVRRAAVAALGEFNGSVVVVDPSTGRVLTIVNQKLAYKSGFIPCSTIKLVTAFAALGEGAVTRDTVLRLSRYKALDLTSALAHSDNVYFAKLGRQLGFKKIHYYAQQFGLGEKAALDIPEEEGGVLTDIEPRNGGVGMMTSFGEGVSMTPLELASLLSSISNGGNLYYLQYPRNQEEIERFVPRTKRRLEISPYIEDVKMGMRAAVDFGTARRAYYDPNEPIMGKTGTCTDARSGAHMGWFGSFNEVGHNKLVVVVMLTGARPINGPLAAGVAGALYKQLSQQNFFASNGPNLQGRPPVEILTTYPCCSR